ncbi:S-adenosyl-L-methionine-dependent methyltransferase [Mycena alexandri]|uniref:S-adenosyl-L-methionine-dependent methyltransferase n=1 Tax=Mycena alexandri TaxID=1745969 RepID=A0AAD6SY34_9AGAR|nr:S-adenosyl-L-methionine-dependent methyltransferase [Mycena alexandri]
MANLREQRSPGTSSNTESLVSSGASGSTLESQQSADITLLPSIWAMSMSIQARAFKQEYGRDYSEVHRLAAAEEQIAINRLIGEHEMFKAVLGKYPPCLPEIMQPDGDESAEPKACLDLGCGCGLWIMELAREFPKCLAVGVDLVPMQSLTMPDNCMSEVDDINLGLEHFYGNFNVVHARMIAAGIKDFVHFIDEVSHVLRPDGLLNIVEFDFHVYDHMEDGNHRRCEVDGTSMAQPSLARWLTFANAAAQKSGGQTDAATHLQRWVTAHPAFEKFVYQDDWIPVSPHSSLDEFQTRMGSLMRDNLLTFLKSGRPLLLGTGVPEEIINELQVNAERELNWAARLQYIRCQSIYCRKKLS